MATDNVGKGAVRRMRLGITLSGDPEAVAAASEELEQLLGACTLQFGPIVPSKRREGEAFVGGHINWRGPRTIHEAREGYVTSEA